MWEAETVQWAVLYGENGCDGGLVRAGWSGWGRPGWAAGHLFATAGESKIMKTADGSFHGGVPAHLPNDLDVGPGRDGQRRGRCLRSCGGPDRFALTWR